MKATIYTMSAFGLHSTEVTLDDWGTMEWAQYPNAAFAVYREKRKRTWRKRIASYRPYMVIVEGWEHKKPPPMLIENGPISQITAYGSFDDRYTVEGDEWLNRYLSKSKICTIADYRHTIGFDSGTATADDIAAREFKARTEAKIAAAGRASR